MQSKTQVRLVRIRGQLIADVKSARGLLGHLEKGGHFSVEQREILPGEWDLTFMEVNMKGKVLFFKTIVVQEKDCRSGFRTVPNGLTLTEAADMFIKQAIRGCQPVAARGTCSPAPVPANLTCEQEQKAYQLVEHSLFAGRWPRLLDHCYAGTNHIDNRLAR